MSAQCFSRSNRLLTGAQYKHVFAQASRSRDRFFTVLARANDCGHARLGLAISKKVDKTAVGRNRIKRVARECFRTHNDLGAFDYVILARHPAKEAQNRQLVESLHNHWQRLFRKTGHNQS
ncbi:MAG: ribonuclease P protein component [bacterium]